MKPPLIQHALPVKNAIDQAHGWSRPSAGDYTAYLFTEDGHQVCVSYSPRELDAADVRYRAVLDSLLLSTTMAHLYLRKTIDLWDKPMPILKRTGMSDIYIERIVAVNGYSDDTSDKVSCMCQIYLASMTENGIPYCSSSDINDAVIPSAWLEKYYPGSAERLQIGLSLELSSFDLAEFIVTPKPENTRGTVLPGDLTDPSTAL